MIQGCLKGVDIPWVFEGNLKEMTRVTKGCFNHVSRKFKEHFKGVSTKSKGFFKSFMDFSKKFQGYFKIVFQRCFSQLPAQAD